MAVRHRRIWKSAVVVGGLLLALLLAVRSYHHSRYPYGRSHCCLKGLGLSLDAYAREHNGHFPAGAGSPEASLTLLARGNYDADANLLRGKTVPEATVQAILDSGGLLGPESCGWHYVEGLTLSDDRRLALVWDKVGLGHNGEDLHGEHSVWRMSCLEEVIPAEEWLGFLQEQEQLMAARGRQAREGIPLLTATIKMPDGAVVDRFDGPYVLRTLGGRSSGNKIGPSQLRWYDLQDGTETYTLEVDGRVSKPIEVQVLNGVASPDTIIFEMQ